MVQSAVFYHYTSQEGLKGILKSGFIRPSRPHPATPGWLDGSNLRTNSDGVVFLTRVDPNNSRDSIAFNNFRYFERNYKSMMINALTFSFSVGVGPAIWARLRPTLLSSWSWAHF